MNAEVRHHPHAQVAAVEAERAAERASVVIDEVSEPDQLDVLRTAMHDIWGPDVVAPRNLLRGLALGGACLLVARHAGAADRDAAVGFALGFLGWERGVHLHSHQVGVVPELRSAGVGFALKLGQRAQALRHGVTEMRWTFDPMLRSNAHFNLVRLGARPVAFFPHCYGDRRDAFNTGDRTDRLEVAWRLDAMVGDAPTVASPEDVQLELPDDFHAFRDAEPGRAAEWRAQVAEALQRGLHAGRDIRMGERGYVILGGHAPEGAS
ncbi:MAG: hypothetical protein KDB40_04785 [Acidimicrobiales bacterium]|nr:hypothetical protein [Acidimicrobiales bacterium]MCB9394178.1 GNAT family N-acetyltransferase [Acidimicrobiaceae bacterium]